MKCHNEMNMKLCLFDRINISTTLSSVLLFHWSVFGGRKSQKTLNEAVTENGYLMKKALKQ